MYREVIAQFFFSGNKRCSLNGRIFEKIPIRYNFAPEVARTAAYGRSCLHEVRLEDAPTSPLIKEVKVETPAFRN
jgi:hypothetical protein